MSTLYRPARRLRDGLAASGRLVGPGPPLCSYSPSCLEEAFSEVGGAGHGSALCKSSSNSHGLQRKRCNNLLAVEQLPVDRQTVDDEGAANMALVVRKKPHDAQPKARLALTDTQISRSLGISEEAARALTKAAYPTLIRVNKRTG